MKVLIKKLLLFLLLFFCWFLIEALLPITTFTHRHFEAVSFQTRVPAKTSIYPNISSSMDAVGDLCHHTPYQVIKHEVWKTDKLGFRNDAFVEEPDILLLGDSFMQGSGLSQDETLTNKMQKKMKDKRVYSMAPSSFSELDKLLQWGVIKKPKLIIFSWAERNIPDPFVPYDLKKNSTVKNSIREMFACCDMNVYIDKALRHYSFNWIRARINGDTGEGVQSKIEPKMFFLSGQERESAEQELDATLKTIITYKKYCDSLGVKLLILPMPDKESVYYELVPFKKQPDYLFKMDSLLQHYNIESINPLELYNDYRRVSSDLLYHYDDTHWNSNATEIISNVVLEKLKKNNP